MTIIIHIYTLIEEFETNNSIIVRELAASYLCCDKTVKLTSKIYINYDMHIIIIRTCATCTAY